MHLQSIIDDPGRWGELAVPDAELDQMMDQGVEPRVVGTQSASGIYEMRDRWHSMFKQDADELLKATAGDVSVTEIHIPVRDGFKVRALVYRSSRTPDSGAPLVVMLHGGGFCAGNAEMEAAACIGSVQAYGCVSVSLEYRMAPEIKFPTPWEDCWDAMLWFTRNSTTLGVDLVKGFILGGTSAGGHLTIPLVHKARDRKLSPPITGIYLNATPALAPQAVPEKYRSLYNSRQSLSNGLSLTSDSINLYDEVMDPEFASPYWSPLLWSTGHGDLSPHFFQICGADMLRDEALIYARELKQEGVETKLVVYEGMPHVFWYDFPSHPTSLRWTSDTTQGLGWLLGHGRQKVSDVQTVSKEGL